MLLELVPQKCKIVTINNGAECVGNRLWCILSPLLQTIFTCSHFITNAHKCTAQHTQSCLLLCRIVTHPLHLVCMYWIIYGSSSSVAMVLMAWVFWLVAKFKSTMFAYFHMNSSAWCEHIQHTMLVSRSFSALAQPSWSTCLRSTRASYKMRQFGLKWKMRKYASDSIYMSRCSTVVLKLCILSLVAATTIILLSKHTHNSHNISYVCLCVLYILVY